MVPYQKFQPTRGFLFLSVIAFVLSGCAFSTIQASPGVLVDYSPQRVSTLTIGQFKSDKLSEEQRQKLVQEINGQLKEQAAFGQVVDKVPVEAQEDQTVILDGEIVEYSEGKKALQWLVGFGAGSAKLSIAFHVSTFDGRQIAAFSAKRTYAGGLGIGGVSFVGMEGLIERVAKDVATTISKWKRGEPIGEEASQPE